MKCVSADFKTENGKNKLSACHAGLKCWLLHAFSFERLASEKFSKPRPGGDQFQGTTRSTVLEATLNESFVPRGQHRWLSGFCDRIKWAKMLRYGKYFMTLTRIVVDGANRRDSQLINSIIRKMKIDDASWQVTWSLRRPFNLMAFID